MNLEQAQFPAPATYQPGGIAVTSKGSEKTEYSRAQNDLPPSQSSSFSRGASSHVAASLFRYQGRIVRIDCIRAQLLASLPLSPVTRT